MQYYKSWSVGWREDTAAVKYGDHSLLWSVLPDANEDICGKNIAADSNKITYTMEEYITLFKIIVYTIGTEIRSPCKRVTIDIFANV